MPHEANGLLHGTLDALVLRTLMGGPRHGYAIARWLEEATDELLQIEEGSLYPALYRMERKGWVEAGWGMSELGRKAKLYQLTAKGVRELGRSRTHWREFSRVIGAIMGVPT